jgi:hypothetical protein
MNLFTLYPKINYDINSFDQVRAIDIQASFKIRDYIKNYRGIAYQPYVVQDGERPDNVSFKLYGNSRYDWLILLVNDMYSIYDDWPRQSQELERYIIEKYGSISNASSTVKYYYDANKNIIDLTTYNSLPAANRSFESVLAWEQRMNDRKRIIKVVPGITINQLQSELNNLGLVAVL